MFNPLSFISKFVKSSNQNELDRISKIVKDNNGTLITCEVMCSDNDGNLLISGTAHWSE